MHKHPSLSRSCAAALAILLAVGGAQARCTFLIDRSGSMAGFHANGNAQQAFARLVTSIAAFCPFTFGFTVGDPKELPDSAIAPALKADTNLDEAFGWWLNQSQSSDTVVMLTDNVADDRAGPASNAQQKFYYEVRSKDRGLAGAEVLGLRLPFEGPLFSLDDGKQDDYRDDRALAVYLIAKKAPNHATLQDFLALRDELTRAVAGAVTRSSDYHAFTVRPFEEFGSDLSTKWIKTKLKVWMKSGDFAGIRSHYDPQTRRIYVDQLPRSEPATIEIPLTITPGPDFDIKGVAVSVVFVTPASAVSPERRVNAQVVPPTIDIHASTPVDVLIRIPVQPFDWTDHPSLWRRLQRLFGPSQIANGRIEINYQFDRMQIAIDKTVSDDWSTDDRADLGRNKPEVQHRLYLLRQLLRGMAASEGDSGNGLIVPLKPIEARFRLIPSMSDTAKLLLVLLAVAAIAVVAYLYFSSSKVYETSGHGGGGHVTLGVVGAWRGTATPLRVHLIRLGPVIVVWWTGGGAMPIPTFLSTDGGTAFARIPGRERPSITLRVIKSSVAGGPNTGVGWAGGNQGRFRP